MATRPLMTRFEYAKVINLRTLQLSGGELPRISKDECEKLFYDMQKIAEVEIERGLVDIQVKRVRPDGKEIVYNVKDMNLRKR